jgi:hypothetical protein
MNDPTGAGFHHTYKTPTVFSRRCSKNHALHARPRSRHRRPRVRVRRADIGRQWQLVMRAAQGVRRRRHVPAVLHSDLHHRVDQTRLLGRPWIVPRLHGRQLCDAGPRRWLTDVRAIDRLALHLGRPVGAVFGVAQRSGKRKPLFFSSRCRFDYSRVPLSLSLLLPPCSASTTVPVLITGRRSSDSSTDHHQL